MSFYQLFIGFSMQWGNFIYDYEFSEFVELSLQVSFQQSNFFCQIVTSGIFLEIARQHSLTWNRFFHFSFLWLVIIFFFYFRIFKIFKECKSRFYWLFFYISWSVFTIFYAFPVLKECSSEIFCQVQSIPRGIVD